MVYPHICIWIEMNIFEDFCQFRNLTIIIKILLYELDELDIINVNLPQYFEASHQCKNKHQDTTKLRREKHKKYYLKVNFE